MLGVFREKRFSPRRVKEDAAILGLTAERIRRKGVSVRLLKPREIIEDPSPEFAFTMCEGPRYLKVLERWEALGHPVFNHPVATRNCHRWRMLPLVAVAGVHLPRFLLFETSQGVLEPFDYKRGVWIKRSDMQSTRRADVRIFYSRSSLKKALRSLSSSGIQRVILQEHISGDLIKFYGVRGSGWFHCLRVPQGEAKGYPFSAEEIHRTAEKAAGALGVDIYGADLVVNEETHYVIDINSWPSFAACREEAAGRIASFLVERHARTVPRLGR